MLFSSRHFCEVYLRLLIAVVYFSTSSHAALSQAFTYAGEGAALWPALFNGCSQAVQQQSPIPVSTAGPFAPVTTIPASIASNSPAGSPLLVPFVLEPDGGYAVLSLAWSGITANINGTAYRASHAIIRRPAEHTVDAATLQQLDISANDVIEQQMFWAIGNQTKLAVSIRAYVPATGGVVEAGSLFDSCASVLASGLPYAPLRALSSNYGLSSGPFLSYYGTMTTPPCESVQWLVDTQLYAIADSSLGTLLPVSIARPLQAISASFVAEYVSVMISPPAANLLGINTSSPLRAWNISINFDEHSSTAAHLILYKSVVGMLSAMSGTLAIAIVCLLIIKATYRSQARSVWKHPRYGTQLYGFGNSALLHDAESDSSEEEEEEREAATVSSESQS